MSDVRRKYCTIELPVWYYSPCRTIQIVGDMFVPPINGWPERLHLYKDTGSLCLCVLML